MSRHLCVSPPGVAAIFLTGCMAGSVVQALSGGALPEVPPIALHAPPPAPTNAVATADPLTPRAVKAFAVRGVVVATRSTPHS